MSLAVARFLHSLSVSRSQQTARVVRASDLNGLKCQVNIDFPAGTGVRAHRLCSGFPNSRRFAMTHPGILPLSAWPSVSSPWVTASSTRHRALAPWPSVSSSPASSMSRAFVALGVLAFAGGLDAAELSAWPSVSASSPPSSIRKALSSRGLRCCRLRLRCRPPRRPSTSPRGSRCHRHHRAAGPPAT